MGLIATLFRWMRPRAEATRPVEAEAEAPADGPVWCVAANVVMEHDFGGGKELRRGTKHFAPGAKVYVYLYFWGMGGERVKVIGRRRKSRRYLRVIMPAKHLANWRAELVYSPYVIEKIREEGEFTQFKPGSDKAKRRAEEIAAGYMERGGKTQPFVTRPPSAE